MQKLIVLLDYNVAIGMQLLNPTSTCSHSSSVPAGSSSWPSKMGANCLLRIAFLMSLLLSAVELSAPLFLLLLRPMLEVLLVIASLCAKAAHTHIHLHNQHMRSRLMHVHTKVETGLVPGCA